MSALVAPAPIGTPGLAVLLLGLACFVMALAVVRWRRGRGQETGARIDTRSRIGMLIQAVAFLLVTLGPVRTTLQPASAGAVGQAVAVAVLVGTCIAMFVSTAAAMGSNWSFTARTRPDHHLVTWGPFATIRHPIYTGLFAMLLAMTVAFGHWRTLIVSLPLFALGTWVRVAEEEALLRARFGPQYDVYAARVKRFLPRLF